MPFYIASILVHVSMCALRSRSLVPNIFDPGSNVFFLGAIFFLVLIAMNKHRYEGALVWHSLLSLVDCCVALIAQLS